MIKHINNKFSAIVLVVVSVLLFGCDDGSDYDTQKQSAKGQAINTTPSLILDVAKRSGCLACHSIDEPVVGPAWMAVSERYKDDPEACTALTDKVKRGGSGNWTEVTGGAPMPPYSPRVSDENIADLVSFILGISGNDCANRNTPLTVDAEPIIVELTQGEQAGFFFLSELFQSYNVELTMINGVSDFSVSYVNEANETIVVDEQQAVDGQALTEFTANNVAYDIMVTASTDATFSVAVRKYDAQDNFLLLAKQSGCLACHSVEKSVVGPSWRAVSERYRDDVDAVTSLIEKVKKGGKGNWTDVTGGAPMPPYSPRVSDENIYKLVTFILGITSNGEVNDPAYLPVDGAALSRELGAGEQSPFYFQSITGNTYTIDVTVTSGAVDVVVEDFGTQSRIEQSGIDTHSYIEITADSTRYDISVTATAAAVFTIAVTNTTPSPVEPLDLAKQSGCLACHSLEKKVVGPSWRAVSNRYRDDPNAEAQLIEKVKKGGKGNWTDVTGGAPMPPYSPRVSDVDIQTLVRFILELNTTGSGPTFLSVGAMPLLVNVTEGEQPAFYFMSYLERSYKIGINMVSGVVDMKIQTGDPMSSQIVYQQTSIDADLVNKVEVEIQAGANQHNVLISAVTNAAFYINVADTTTVPPISDMMQLAKASGCLACHSVDKKVVGPSWQAVSERYLNDPNAESFLIEKVKSGGNGNWGEVTGGAPMPPYSPRVSDENITALVQYILNLTK